jgi:hypothetical protein
MMMAEWKKKAPKQAKWASRYPTQVMKQAKRVWKWSIEKGDGAAWLYFIFAICQWLPTNHRVHYNENSGRRLDKCMLCALDEVDDMYHFLRCPALQAEQHDLISSVEAKLRLWQVPFSQKRLEPIQVRTCQRWFRQLRTIFEKSISASANHFNR